MIRLNVMTKYMCQSFTLTVSAGMAIDGVFGWVIIWTEPIDASHIGILTMFK